jgi:diguanylate cyclase (GGDEF)-like protein/PAS domain S-box-containing protein
VWGYTQGELLGRAPADFGAPGERARVRQWLARNTQADGSFRDLEYRIVNRDGEERWLLINAVGVFDETGRRVGQRGAGRDITDRKQAEARINHLATRDALTDLPNRVLLHDRLQQALASARRQGCTVAVVFIDLDRFKNINDSLGHEVGDRLLREVAARLSACLRETDTLARLGGDEFVAVVDGLKDAAEASGVGDKILRALAAPFTVGEHALVSTASLGVSLFPADAEDAVTLMRNADTAMYHAKAAGRNRLQFFSADMNHRAMERHGIESALRTALEARQLRLWYQPQVELASDRPVAAEALLRWQHPELGAVPPAKFIPIAEESGLIGPIGDWVLERACEQLCAWGGACELRLSLNLSIGQLRDSHGFLDRARAIIRASGLDPARLEFEITETLLASNVAEHARVLRALGDLGCSIAVDDFGTGYSSLSYLKRLPIDTVKIDRVFVRDIVSDPDDAAIVGAVVAMARKLELEVVAEGVETVPQLRLLRELGCDRYQGYVFSPAVPPEEFAEKFLAPVPAGP